VVKRSKKEAFISKIETAAVGASVGASIGATVFPPATPILAGLGAVGGLIYGDTPITFSEPMICIPAREQYLIQGSPSVIIYAHAGETLIPSGGNVDDTAEGIIEGQIAADVLESLPTKRKKQKANKWNAFVKKEWRAYKKANPNGKRTFSSISKQASKKYRRQQ